MKLEGRVAIVTGSSMGIGQGIAALFLEHGARVVVNSRHQGRAEAAADRLSKNRYADRLLPIGADVADPDATANMVQQTMARWGQIDILVNNAGINAIRPSEELPVADWRRVMAVNLDGCFYMAQACARQAFIPQQRGNIINIASIYGLVSAPRRAVYSASKHALVGLTKVLAIEWARYNIRVNALCPGYIMTPMEEMDTATGDYTSADILRRTPMGRYGKVVEQAQATLWLASEDSAFTTGAVLTSDGGWVAYGAW